MHRCTEADLAKFYEPEKSTKPRVEAFRETGGLFCLDWQKLNVELYGYWQAAANYGGLDIIVAPCGFQYELQDGSLSPLRDDCNWNKTAAEEYFGTIGFTIYYNEGIFKQEEFGEHRVTYQSIMQQISSEAKTPAYIPGFVD